MLLVSVEEGVEQVLETKAGRGDFFLQLNDYIVSKRNLGMETN